VTRLQAPGGGTCPATSIDPEGLALTRDRELVVTSEGYANSLVDPGTGKSIKLYDVALPGATNVNGAESLNELRRVRPADKRLLFDLDRLRIPLDNEEGLTFGPRLPDGRRSLVLVSDNNFAASRFTQFLLFALN
jgi:hypothetical protein